DHLRMLTFSITDGALPGNKGRGAVLRSVLRRAFRFGYQHFGQRDPFIWKLVPALVQHMGGAYPEVETNPGRVQDIMKGEEADFLRTVDRGLEKFNLVVGDAICNAYRAVEKIHGPLRHDEPLGFADRPGHCELYRKNGQALKLELGTPEKVEQFFGRR